MSAEIYTAEQIVALLAVEPASGILAGADHLNEEASRVSLGEGAFAGMTAEDSARLVEWMLAAVRRWRGVVERHGGQQLPTAPDGYRVCSTCDQGPPPARHVTSPCPDLLETADEARAYLGGAR